MEIGEFLSAVPAFMDFSQKELNTLSQAMAVKTYPNAHVFIKEGKAADSMYLLVEGEVVVTREREDHGYDVLERLKPGELFGLVSLIDHGPRSASCTAVGEVKIATLPRTAFQLLYMSHSRIGYHFQHLIARQLVRDLRAYTNALSVAVDEEDRYKLYQSMQIYNKYRGPERRGGDRRNTERRSSFHLPIS